MELESWKFSALINSIWFELTISSFAKTYEHVARKYSNDSKHDWGEWNLSNVVKNFPGSDRPLLHWPWDYWCFLSTCKLLRDQVNFWQSSRASTRVHSLFSLSWYYQFLPLHWRSFPWNCLPWRRWKIAREISSLEWNTTRSLTRRTREAAMSTENREIRFWMQFR